MLQPFQVFRPLMIAVIVVECSVQTLPADNMAGVFETDVRPILKEHCFHCHGDDGIREGSLDLRLKRLIVEGGESGPALMPGDAAGSLLLKRVIDGEMPPGEEAPRLRPEEISRIRRWIDAGAVTRFPEPEGEGHHLDVTPADTLHWAFQPITSPSLPAIPVGSSPNSTRNPIDLWINARLSRARLHPAPPASRLALIRRLSFDLRGLPPTPQEVSEFLENGSPNAWQEWIDRILSSPEYGERWGRHWLDAAGYADSEGVTDDDPQRPHAYHYRDYVIRSFNANKPWSRFLLEQLAGDELFEGDPQNLTSADTELLAATGFLRMAPDGTAGKVDNPELARNEVVAETIKIVSTSVLGLTLGCAQCHSHRYDPITQRDYYSFRAIFEPALNWKQWKTPQQRRVSLATDADRAIASDLEQQAKEVEKKRLERQKELIAQTYEKELAKLDDSVRETVRAAHDTPAKERTPEQKQLLKENPSVNVTAGSLYLYDKKAADELKKMAEEAASIRKQKPEELFLRALMEPAGSRPETFVFARGDHEQPTEVVTPAELTVVRLATDQSEEIQPASGIEPAQDPDASMNSSRRRLNYARWLINPQHPLTARVLVNRIWRHHFGQGLVATMDDFGLRGSPPTHPELLDWLAFELIAHDWDLKWLHRLILNSAAYRRGPSDSDTLTSADPEHRLLGARNARRLDAEVLRDSVLHVSGQLNRRPFGKPVPVMADRVGKFVIGIENLNAGRPGPVIPMRGEELRRSVYVESRRSRPLAVLDTFDLPRMTPNCVSRSSSTVAPQALMMMNSEFILQAADRLSSRLMRDAGEDPTARLRLLWHLTLSRPISSDETEQALAFVEHQTETLKQQSGLKNKTDEKLGALAWKSLCQAMLSCNEFLYVD